MAEKNILSQIEIVARRNAKGRDHIVLFTQIIVSIVFPVIEAVLTAQWGELTKNISLQVIFWSIVILHIVCAILLLFRERTDALYFEHLDTIREVEKIRLKSTKINEIKNQQSFAAEALQKALDALILYQSYLLGLEPYNLPKGEIVSSALSFILYPTIQLRQELFGFGNGAMYNIAVYLYDNEDGKLKLIFREHDNRITTKNRDWEIGVGHIGVCYAQQNTLYSPDLMLVQELHDIKGGDEVRGHDNRYYRSMLSTPIFESIESDDNDVVLGVLVVTSSEPNQFNREVHEPFIMSMSNILTLFFIFVRNYNKLR